MSLLSVPLPVRRGSGSTLLVLGTVLLLTGVGLAAGRGGNVEAGERTAVVESVRPNPVSGPRGEQQQGFWEGGSASLLDASSVGIIAGSLLGFGLAAGFVWWCTTRVREERERLTRTVAERTSEANRQKKQLEAYNRELLQINKRLRGVVEEKSRLLGMAAHDLKNALFGIRALSEIVLENEALSPPSERKLDLIRESSHDTLQLLDELLSSAANSVRTNVDPQPLDVAALVQWVLLSFEPQAERKAQKLRCSVPDEDCVVKGDKRALREAITNLVSNAVKYSPPGAPVDVLVNRTGEEVRVSVTDIGPGLSEQDQERLFAPFQRLTPEPTAGESSSGLGLYIVKQVVDHHDGAIEVESELGVGSTFTLVFPAVHSDGALSEFRYNGKES